MCDFIILIAWVVCTIMGLMHMLVIYRFFEFQCLVLNYLVEHELMVPTRDVIVSARFTLHHRTLE